MRAIGLALAAATLAACAGRLQSTLAPVPARPLPPGAEAAVLAPPAAAAALADLQAALGRVRGPLLRRVERKPEQLRLELDPGFAFAAGSAQLRVESLQAWSDLGAVLRTAPATVVHVLAQEPAESGIELPASLAARRCAAALEQLQRLGLRESRLRREGRIRADGASQLELVVLPVIAGREREAWQPPR